MRPIQIADYPISRTVRDLIHNSDLNRHEFFPALGYGDLIKGFARSTRAWNPALRVFLSKQRCQKFSGLILLPGNSRFSILASGVNRVWRKDAENSNTLASNASKLCDR